ncbi:MAG TPA: tripartite tricarboxylate transporter TctB family protein, partial [Candidatus Sulfotelmatobacter sp.]|nr:tripartite tricarboxylate transporter TctB family protein [Candidatus Sulfotelmatobacter sp.]
MRAADLVTAAAFILLGAVVIIDAVRLGIGWGTDGPKSGFFPFWLAVFMVAASTLIALQAVRQRTSRPFVTREQLRPVLAVLLPATALV